MQIRALQHHYWLEGGIEAWSAQGGRVKFFPNLPFK